MNDADLRSRLSALRPPSPDAAVASRAHFRALLAFNPTHPVSAQALPADDSDAFARALTRVLDLPRRFGPGLAAACCTVLLLLLPALFLRPHASSPSYANTPAAASLRLLTELEMLFPGQLDAVVERDGGIQLALADTPTGPAPADQAILVELTRGPQRLRVLAYSGRSVRLRLDRNELRFLPLLTGSGQVLLAGDDFAWSPATPTPPDPLVGWRVTARPLAAVL